MSDLVVIDGSTGEGGGQIVRSALTLSMVTGRAFEITNIRAQRSKPGLLKQHLTAVQAAREICGGGVTGAELGSRQLIFAPGPVQTRSFTFDIGSAGSTTLVAQTLIPALMTADGASSLVIEGGTHNMAAPPFDYLQQVYLSIINQLGPHIGCELLSHGFYPAGGGKIRVSIEPSAHLRGLELMELGGPPIGQVTALVSRLPEHIGQRECELIRHRAGWQAKQCTVRNVTDSPGPGNIVMIRLTSPRVTEMFTGFGKKGVSAEQVAAGAWREARQFLMDQVPVGEYLCDQLLLPLALAAAQGQTSSLLTVPLSQHSQTHIDIIQKFLNIRIEIESIGPRQVKVGISFRNH
ncbi:MAG TPA: RNA 3'-terminal phosphate cyclase [Pirellulaceae bacterium]|nr:RNA 3'-terminal phosphate cyclase [Pirellulaceae bacterium]